MSYRSNIIVLGSAAVLGVMMARGASAIGEPRPALVARGAVASGSVATTANSAGGGDPGAARDENEPESHAPGSGDNPYDEPAPTRPSPPPRIPVVIQGGMIRLPGAHFVMGSSNPRAPANERPSRPNTVAAFWIDRTEVAVGAYRACVDAEGCAVPSRTSASCTYDLGDPDLPISCVHWREAEAYCRFVQKRLPTEAEWEYAARGPFASPFPWGSSPSSCANAVTLINDASGKSCASRPARVGTHPSGASLFGVQDLSGNVEEWTADWYADSVGLGPAPRVGAAHVLRGGGWLSPPSMSRTTARDWGSALEAGPNVGFRCARSD